MHNYKRPKRKKISPESLDGFVPSTENLEGETANIKKRFSTHYRPGSQEGLNGRRDLGRIASHDVEGFHSRNSNIEHEFEEIDSSEHIEQPLDLSLSDDIYRPPGLLGRKKTKKHATGYRKKFVKGFAVVMVAFVVAVSSLFAYGYIKSRQIFRGNGDGAAALEKNVDPSRLNGEGDGRINILLLGKGGPGHTAPDLTDTLLLASIDPIQNEAALLSIPRDMYVQDQNGYSTKINAVYSNAKQSSYSAGGSEDQAEDAGLSAVKQTVSDVIGVPIHYYVMVNFQAFEDAINIVGGLDIFIEEALVDWSVAWLLGGDPVVAAEGLQTLDGKRALLYARSRKGSARGDFDRTERQREIIVALQQEVLSTSTFSNPFKIIELMNTFGDNVRTDLNGVDEIRRLYEIGKNIGSDKIISVGLADDPILVTTDFVANQSVVRPIAGLYQYDEIHSFVRNTLRDAFLKQENSRVVILNGTSTAGIATAKQTELQSYGYNVVSVDNAPTTDYQNTRLISLNPNEHRYTESYLTRRLGLTAENTFIDGIPTAETADFVIILGNDEAFKTSN